MPSPSLVPTEHATPFYPRLAQMIGVTEALIFVQIRFLTSLPQFGEARKGVKWVHFSYAELHAYHFPCFSRRAIRRAVDNLVGLTLLLSDRYMVNGSHAGRWLAVNEQSFVVFTEEKRLQIREGGLSRLDRGSGQIGQVYTESSTESTKTTKRRRLLKAERQLAGAVAAQAILIEEERKIDF